jgi:hypothetical protein
MLPYRTDWRSLATLLDALKGKGSDRSTLEARLGAGESFRETLNAAEQLRVARRDEAGEVQLTEQGRRLAYAANERERQFELAAAMLGYPPYGIALQRALDEELPIIDGPWVERVWQVDMRLGQPRNRVEEARTFFFRLADDAGLGTYHRGVRGQPTRLELSANAAERLEQLSQATGDEASPQEATIPLTKAHAPSSTGASVALNLTIDMSDWDLERIEALLRLVGIISGTERD